MNLTKSSVVGALISLSLVAACGRDDKTNDNGPDAGNGSGTDGGTTGKGMTVKDVQADSLPSGTAIELDGVVVTAIDGFGNSTGDIWVQDLDGGARSGVHVYGASLTDVSKLAVGDLVNIKGAQKYEYAPGSTTNPTSTQSLTEVEGVAKGTMTVTKTGTGAVPAPHPLDAIAIAAMATADRATFLEDWEGVPVILANARPSNPGSFGSGAADQKSFDVTNVFTVESNLAAFPASSANNTTCYASITGVVDFVVGKYTLLPTDTSGFVANGTGCAAATVFTPTTIADIQSGKTLGNVALTGVYVTAWSVSNGTAGKTLWVSDGPTATAGTGVEVFSANGVDDTIRVLGTKIDIQGEVAEFTLTAGNPTLTEFSSGKSTVKLNTAATAAPTPLLVTLDLVSDNSETGPSEKYEGTLVTLSNVLITALATDANAADTSNQVTITDNNKNSLTMDDDVVFKFGGTVPAKGTCYKTLVGVMDVDTKNNRRTFNPRSTSADDMKPGVAGTDCTATVP